MGKWKTLSSKIVYKNPWMRIHEDQVINPAGKPTLYGYMESTCGSVYIVPIDKEGYTYLIRQYRYPIQQEAWEFIAGRTDDDAPEVAARRELLEETGLEAKSLTFLGDIYIANGITSFKSYIYLAHDAEKVTDQLDEADGILEVKRVSTDEVRDMIVAGTLQCSPSITAFFMAMTYLKKENHG